MGTNKPKAATSVYEDEDEEKEQELQDVNIIAQMLTNAKFAYERFSAKWFGEELMDEEQKKMNEITIIMSTYGAGVLEDDPEVSEVWIDRSWFDVAISIVVILNAIVIGLETDLQGPGSRHPIWITLEVLFLILFLAEITMKVYAHTWRWVASSPLNILTTFCCFMAFIQCVILNPIGIDMTVRLISLIRVLGLARLYRVIKRSEHLMDLKLLLQNMAHSAQTFLWCIVLLIVITYIFAVIVTQQIGQNVSTYGNYYKLSGGWDFEEKFGTVGRSFFTLMEVMTMDGWISEVLRHVIVNQWWMVLLFGFFLLITNFGVINVFVAVIVECTMSAATQNRKRAMQKQERAHRIELEGIRDIFYMCDMDGSNSVDRTEFMRALEVPEVRWKLRLLELPEEDVLKLFTVLDGSGFQRLSFDDFIQGCIKLKGFASSKDLLSVMAQADSLAAKMDSLETTLQQTERMMRHLDEVTKRITKRFGSAVIGSRKRLAHQAGGGTPVVPPSRKMEVEPVGLGDGNRPILPPFPDLLK